MLKWQGQETGDLEALDLPSIHATICMAPFPGQDPPNKGGGGRSRLQGLIFCNKLGVHTNEDLGFQ